MGRKEARDESKPVAEDRRVAVTRKRQGEGVKRQRGKNKLFLERETLPLNSALGGGKLLYIAGVEDARRAIYEGVHLPDRWYCDSDESRRIDRLVVRIFRRFHLQTLAYKKRKRNPDHTDDAMRKRDERALKKQEKEESDDKRD
jgi:hypothetical protein